jgi:hypothetical protein
MFVLATHMGPGNQLVEVTPGGITSRGSCPPTKTGMPIFHNGRLYRAGGALERYDLVDNGFRRVWKGQVLGDEGSLVLTGDQKLIAKGRGKLLLYALDGTKLAERDARGRWPHVTFANGRVLCKDNRGNIDCFVVAATSVVPVAPPAR